MKRLQFALLFLLAPLASCEFGKTLVGPGVSTIVVHAVLNPSAEFEQILVERSLSGTTLVDTSLGYDPNDPIASGGGIPISDATVIIYGPNGDSVIAGQGFGNGGGAGVYVIANSRVTNGTSNAPSGTPSFPFAPGAHYRLRITTTAGEVVTGSTTIPSMRTAIDSVAAPQPFDRTRDTLALTWPAIAAARSYLVQISTPFNTYETLIDSLTTRTPGDARDTETRSLPHMFIPGFTQIVIVGAVDSNYYDYERFRTDISNTTTPTTHLTGARGVFGAYVPLVFRQLAVTAPFTYPIEGSYTNTTAVSNAPARLQLYVESPAANHTLAQLSGNYVSADGETGGIIGVFDGTHLTLNAVQGQSVLDTLMVIDGTLRPDSITGTIRQENSQVIYTKSPPPG